MEQMGALEIDGLVEQREELDRLLMSNPDTEKKVKYLIRKVLQGVRDEVKGAARNAIKGELGDPRNAAEAVKYSLYKQVLGGNVSLLNRKRAGQGSEYTPPRNPSHRGGNRRSRNADTKRIDSYNGKDRAFILRFLNQGTKDRSINFTHNPKRKETEWTKRPNTGNRGSITARDFFSQSANMEKAAQQLAQLIDDLIKTELS